jgi:hypothetical protein
MTTRAAKRRASKAFVSFYIRLMEHRQPIAERLQVETDPDLTQPEADGLECGVRAPGVP